MTAQMTLQSPLPVRSAIRRVARCVRTTASLLAEHRVHLPPDLVGTGIRFADGTSSRVYRETVIADRDEMAPCVLVVTFRLRLVRGWGHRLFRWESLLNTPLFVGFPGFVSKLWLAHDEAGAYRGLYKWDGPERAETYARSLWRVLALVSVPGSIRYRVLPGIGRDQLLADPTSIEGGSVIAGPDDWSRVVEVEWPEPPTS